jgi:transcriptional regulator with XRE-family HTH domain
MSQAEDQTVRDHVAAEVRAELARQKLSVSEAARRLGWTQPFLQRRVMGSRTFEVSELAQVAQLLSVPIEQFFPDYLSARSKIIRYDPNEGTSVIKTLSSGRVISRYISAPGLDAAA